MVKILYDFSLSLPQEEERLSAPDQVYGWLELPPPKIDRPYTYLNMAMTLDGKVTLGQPGKLLSGSMADRLGMDELRAVSDAVIIGAGTLRAENPRMRIRTPRLREERIRRGMPPDPRYIIVTGKGELPFSARIFREDHPLILTTQRGLDQLKPLEERAEIRAFGEERVNLGQALFILKEEYGICHLLCEGGPNLAFEMIREGLMDELFLTLSPLLKGGRDTLTLLEGEGFPPEKTPRLQLLSLREERGELFLRYRVLYSSS